jgi:hypothetical protein
MNTRVVAIGLNIVAAFWMWLKAETFNYSFGLGGIRIRTVWVEDWLERGYGWVYA